MQSEKAAPPVTSTAQSPIETVTCRSIDFPVDRHLLHERVIASLAAGRYEGQEANVVEKILRSGDRVLELGGGVGLISGLCGVDERVDAVRTFEADPRMAAYITRVHALNRITKPDVCNAVLSHSLNVTHVPFYVRDPFWGSSLCPTPGDYVNVVEVPLQSFNNVVTTFRPTIVICDIEGGEVEIMKHANLTGVSRVIVELHSRITGGKGVHSVFQSLGARGFIYNQFHSTKSVVLFSMQHSLNY